MEIELLDADGRPRAPRPGDGRVRRPGSRRWSPALGTAAVGVVVACAVLVVGGLVAGALRSRATDDLERRIISASTAEAASVERSGTLEATDPAIALQVLQSPGAVVDSTGPPADRAMVVEVPRPATPELSTFDVVVGSSVRRYRVAATTLPTQPGVAGRTVVAAALPLTSAGAADAPLHVAATVLAAIGGLGAALATRRKLQRRPDRPT